MKPTEFTFMFSINFRRVFEEIRSSDTLKSKLLDASCNDRFFARSWIAQLSNSRMVRPYSLKTTSVSKVTI